MIWLRAFDLDTEDELKAAVNHAKVVRYLGDIPKNSLVVGRYSVLPMYRWITEELALGGSRLVNSHGEHKYIANMEWLEDLNGLTFPTYTRWDTLPEGSYVVKGRTNSRKWEWKTKMFAETAGDVKRIASALYEDPLIREQGVVARTYTPLEEVSEGINGLPVTNEWRFFVFDGEILTGAYYWSLVPEEDLPFDPLRPPAEAVSMVQDVIARVAEKATFYVVDVAKGVDGRWWVVELNDGQMSGLSYNDPVTLYEGLDAAGQALAEKRSLQW